MSGRKRTPSPRPPELPRRGERIEIDVTALDSLGDGIARVAGRELHLPGALPGDRVRARIEHQSRQHPRAWATVEQILEAAEGRRTPPCPHQGRCTGCALMIADEPTQRRLKRLMLGERFGIDIDRLVHRQGGELGYRWSSKRVVVARRGSFEVGSFRRGTHLVASMTGCLVEHPLVRRCADELDEHLAACQRATAARGGALLAQEAAIRAAWLRTDGVAGCLLGLVGPPGARPTAARLAATLETPTTVTWSVASHRDGNGLRGDATEVLRGAGRLRLELGGRTLELGPMGFLQPNPPVAELAYRDLVAGPGGTELVGRRAIDLFAGAGATTSLLRERFAQVAACDEHPESAATLGEPALRADELLARELERAGPPVDLVVADPPRAGLGPDVTRQLLELGAARIHLMSCSAASLARDLAALCRPAGRYELEACRGYDTLPQTPHVEVVAWLGRQAG